MLVKKAAVWAAAVWLLAPSLFAASNAPLALRLLKAAGPGNAVVAPAAVENGLRLIQSRAPSAPADEIAKVLGPPPPPRAHPSLVSASAVWTAPGVPGGAPATTVDFRKPAAARARINAWLAAATRNQLTDIAVRIDPETRLLLVSAVFMRVQWQARFEPDQTKDALFHVAPKREAKVKMMAQREVWFPNARRDGVQLLELPYTDRDLSMILILPDAVHGLPAVEAKLTPRLLDTWIGALSSHSIDVYLPRFRIETTVDVTAPLQAAGIRRALANSRAVSSARIDVDEAGTVAAADFQMVVTSTQRYEPPVFRADHPFLYLIRSKATGEIFFIGRVASPASTP